MLSDQVKPAIVGDFFDASPTLKDFIYESNRGAQIFFVDNFETAKEMLFAARRDIAARDNLL